MNYLKNMMICKKSGLKSLNIPYLPLFLILNQIVGLWGLDFGFKDFFGRSIK